MGASPSKEANKTGSKITSTGSIEYVVENLYRNIFNKNFNIVVILKIIENYHGDKFKFEQFNSFLSHKLIKITNNGCGIRKAFTTSTNFGESKWYSFGALIAC